LHWTTKYGSGKRDNKSNGGNKNRNFGARCVEHGSSLPKASAAEQGWTTVCSLEMHSAGNANSGKDRNRRNCGKANE